MSKVSDEFYRRILTAIHAPVTPATLHLCHAWQACEGGNAENNPWNTTQPAEGATDYNSVGVKNFPDQATGVHATVVTLQNGRYEHILWALRHQDADAFGEAVDSSPWGTHGVTNYLAQNRAPEPSGDDTEHGRDVVSLLPTLAQGAGMHNPNGNNHVRVIQATLNLHDWDVHVDGKYGPDTESAIRAFQADAGITEDGVTGPDTYGKLLFVS